MVYTLTVVRRAVRQGSSPQMYPTWAAGTGAVPTLVPLLMSGDPLRCAAWNAREAFCGDFSLSFVDLWG